MSGLAKVFLVINVVLTVIFLGTSATLFSVRKDWKNEFLTLQSDYKKRFENQGKDIAKLAERVQVWTDLSSVQHTQIINLKAASDTLKRNLTQAETDLAAAKTEIASQKSLLEQRDGRLTKADEQIQSLASKLRDAVTAREEANARALAADAKANTDFLERTQQEELVAALRKEKETLLAESEQLRIENEILRKGGPTGVAVPEIPAKIMGVKNMLVVLSVGSDSQVRPGMEFMVYRGNQYLGDVKIQTVYKDMSGAEITYLVEGAEIREGDDAKTKRL